jgi:fucose permease
VSFQQKTDVRTIILAYTCFLLLGLGTGLLGVAWSTMRAEFGLPLEAQGALTLAAPLGYSLISVGIGRFALRYGVRMMLTGMSVIAAVGFTILSGSPVWLLMIVGSFITGAGTGGVDAGLNLYAAAHFSPRAMQWLHAMWGLGFALSPAIFSRMIDAGLSWRVGYGVLVVLTLILGIIIFLYHGWKSVSSLSESETSAKKHIPFSASLRLPIVWISLAVFAVYVGVELMPNVWAPSLFTEVRGLDLVTAGNWVAAYGTGLTIGRIVFGAIANRFSPNFLLRASMLGAVLGIVGLWVGGTSIISVIGLAVTGFCFGPIFPLLMSATPERLGEHAANTISFQMAAVGLGNAFLPAAAGVVAGQLGLEIVVPIMFGLGIILFGLHEWLMVLTRERVAATAAA